MWLPPTCFDVRCCSLIPIHSDDAGIVHVEIVVVGPNLGIYTHWLRVAKQKADSIHSVDPHVSHSTATGKLLLGKPTCWSPVDVHAISFGADDFAQLARSHLLTQPNNFRGKSPNMAHHEQGPRLLTGCQHRLSLGRVHRHGLLDQHMHACLKGSDALRGMQIVGCADNESVHVTVLQQVCHICILARNPEFGGKDRHGLRAVIDNSFQCDIR